MILHKYVSHTLICIHVFIIKIQLYNKISKLGHTIKGQGRSVKYMNNQSTLNG